MDFIMSSLNAEVKWGVNQKPVLWMLDKRSGVDVQLEHDAQLIDMLESYKPEKHMTLLVGVYDKTVVAEGAVADDVVNPLCVGPADGAAACHNICNPPEVEKGQATSESKAANADKANADEEEDELPDIFNFGEEYVGVNDEIMYMPPPPPPTEQPEVPTEPAGADITPSEHTAKGGVPLEAEVNDIDPDI